LGGAQCSAAGDSAVKDPVGEDAGVLDMLLAAISSIYQVPQEEGDAGGVPEGSHGRDPLPVEGMTSRGRRLRCTGTGTGELAATLPDISAAPAAPAPASGPLATPPLVATDAHPMAVCLK